MNYQESLAYLDSLGKFGIRLGMEQLDSFSREMNGMTKKKMLKPMPDGMVEHIAHLPL